jgi:hypothetical protein
MIVDTAPLGTIAFVLPPCPSARDRLGGDSVAPMVSGPAGGADGRFRRRLVCGATVARCTFLASGRPRVILALLLLSCRLGTRRRRGRPVAVRFRSNTEGGLERVGCSVCNRSSLASQCARMRALIPLSVSGRRQTLVLMRGHRSPAGWVGARRPSSHRPGSSSHRPGSELPTARRGCLGQGTRTSFPRTCPPSLMR